VLPKSLTGWIFLIVVISVLIWGAAGAGLHLGHAAHEVLTGTRNFFAGLQG
jgi:hypothetical protein